MEDDTEVAARVAAKKAEISRAFPGIGAAHPWQSRVETSASAGIADFVALIDGKVLASFEVVCAGPGFGMFIYYNLEGVDTGGPELWIPE